MPDPDPRVATLAERYSADAEAYLEVYSPYLLPFQRTLLRLLNPASARRVLDLGSGPGAAIPHIRASAPSAFVVAADRAIGMIALAPREVARVALDAMTLPFADGAFDVVTMAFVAFHLPDPRAGFAEAARVLADGGRLGVATWGEDETIGAAWSAWDEELDRHGAPGNVPTGLPHYQSLGTPEALAAPLVQAGFRAIDFHTERWEYRPSHPEWMAFMSKHVVSDRLDHLDDETRRRCVEALAARTRELPAADLGLESGVLFAVARR